jgi:hypothetical protein
LTDSGCLYHALKTEVIEGVKVKIIADLIHSFFSSDEFSVGRKVYTIIAGVTGRRAADQHMHLFDPHIT